MRAKITTVLSTSAMILLTGCTQGVTKAVPLPALKISDGRIAYIGGPIKIPANQDTVMGTVYVVGVDGSNPHPITKSDCYMEPAWSRDGASIAFASNFNQPGKPNYIFVANSDGTGLRAITEGHASVGGPAWSPDNKEIAYHCWDPGSALNNIHVVGSDGKDDHKLGSDSHTQTYPCWSPNGKQVLFHTQEKGSDWDITVMNADGSDARKLTHGSEMDWLPAYSPDGSKIAFWSTRTGSWEIFIMNSDGSNITQLTHENGRTGIDISRPTWSPDGKYIAYATCRTTPGKMDVLLIDMKDRELCLTSDPMNHVAPSWSAMPMTRMK